MFDYTGTYTDQYQLTMSQIYFLRGHQNQSVVFDYFFRKLPFGSGYAIFAGLDCLLDMLENLRFDAADLVFLQQQQMHPDFIEYLRAFRFTGSIYAATEGDVIFPTAPVLFVEGNIIEAQLIETLLLNCLNFQTLIATKAARIKHAAKSRKLIDFGLRRAQGTGGYDASRAACIGGFEGTSNVRAARDYQIPLAGTMAHAFVQSYDNELAAFRDFVSIFPQNSVLLVDTYNTLESGLPHAIVVAKEMEQRGERLLGIRLDSGDLAYLSKKSRQMLDKAGLSEVKITVSNQLDEYVIKSLLEQGAPIDIFGVGTSLVIGRPDAALDGVYKLASADNSPRMKLSESIQKTTLPFKKQVYRMSDSHGHFVGADVIACTEEATFEKMHHPFEEGKSFSLQGYTKEPLLHPVMLNGKRVLAKKTLPEIAAYSAARLNLLPEEYKRFDNPHLYKIGLTEQLKQKRDQLIKAFRAREKV